MPAKHIWVRDQDLPLWERLVSYAADHRLTVSSAALNAIQEFLERHEDE